jgi:hypothetical protein
MADPVMALVALWGVLARLLDLAAAAIAFDGAAFAYVAGSAFGRSMALVIVFFAGVSQTLGESLVLFLNRVRPARFLLSLVLTGLVYVANVIATAASLVVGALLIWDLRLDLPTIVGIQALAYAPRLFGMLVLMPYLGQPIHRGLEVWVLALTIFGLTVGLQIPVALAAGSALSGWIVMQVLTILFGAPLTALLQRLRRLVSGSPLDVDPRDLAASLTEKARDVFGREDRR